MIEVDLDLLMFVVCEVGPKRVKLEFLLFGVLNFNKYKSLEFQVILETKHTDISTYLVQGTLFVIGVFPVYWL